MPNKTNTAARPALSDRQARILASMHTRNGVTHSGRGGWNVRSMRALEKAGFVWLRGTYTHERMWGLTDAGRVAAADAHAAYLASLSA